MGNSGSWSELEHWATASGGESFYSELPSAIDNVFFDEKSVTENSTVIEIDLPTVAVRDLTLEGLKVGTSLRTKSAVESELNIYGNVVLSEGLELFFDDVYFPGDTVQSILSKGSSWGHGTDLKISSLSQIEILDDLRTHDLSISKGSFNANGHTIQVNKNFSMNTIGDPNINLNNSHIIVKNWIPSSSKLKLQLDQTKITCSGIFYGEGFWYDELVFSGRNWVYGTVKAGNLEFSAGSEILILPGDTIMFENLLAVGNEQDSITIASREEGEHGYLYNEEGNVEAQYLIIRDNHALGGADFVAYYSNIDGGNVEGWTSPPSDVSDFSNRENLFYPNPTSDSFVIQLDVNSSRDFRIFDAFGILIRRVESGDYLHEIKISTADWSSGVYHIVADDHDWYERMVIVKK